MKLSFSGSGFLSIYHIGVASCFKQHAPEFLKDAKLAGASAGAIVACCLLTGCELGQCTSFVLRLATKTRSRTLGPLHPTLNILELLYTGLDEVLPNNAYEIASGRLFISLTRVSDRQNVLVSQYDTNDELLQALMCSAFVPFYCGFVPPSFKGVRYVDGGLSDNMPSLGPDTITVSVLSGESDICPNDNSNNSTHIVLGNTSIQFTSQNLYRLSRALFPPHPQILSQMCKEGFDDALRYLQRKNMISCGRHISISSSIVPIYDHHEFAFSSASPLMEDETDYQCQECREHQQMNNQIELFNSLPPSVVAALQAACDSVNSGVLGFLYNLPAFRVLALLSTPWILPLDICYTLITRFLYWVPYMPRDARHISSELAALVKYLLQRLERHRHHYGTRFQCQVEIKEVNYNPYANTADDDMEFMPQPLIRNMNIGFAVDFDTMRRGSLRGINPLQQLEGRMDQLDIEMVEIETIGPGENTHLQATGHHLDIQQDGMPGSQEIFETLERCLHASNEKESAIAYYYNEKQSNLDDDDADENIMDEMKGVTITEIFTLDDSVMAYNSRDADLSWDYPNWESEADPCWDNWFEWHVDQDESAAEKQSLSRPGSSVNVNHS